jgi:hypothetical protein
MVVTYFGLGSFDKSFKLKYFNYGLQISWKIPYWFENDFIYRKFLYGPYFRCVSVTFTLNVLKENMGRYSWYQSLGLRDLGIHEW